MNPDVDIRRAEEARQLLDHPIFKEACQVIEERLVNLLASADTSADKRQRCCDLLASHRALQRYVYNVIVSGKMAAQEIERQANFADRMRQKVANLVN